MLLFLVTPIDDVVLEPSQKLARKPANKLEDDVQCAQDTNDDEKKEHHACNCPSI